MMMLKCGQFATIERGFYEGFFGRVLDRRCILWYRLDMGDGSPWIPRWNLSVTSTTKASKRLRANWIKRNK